MRGRRAETSGAPSSKARWVLRGRLALAILLAGVAASAGMAPSGDPAVRRGRALYEIHCLRCHGEDGRGRGPEAANLESRPTDLTRIRDGNDGEWPRNELVRQIDGRQATLGHGGREMPIWGLSFQDLDRPEAQEAEVEERLRALLDYLESIQVGSD